MAEELLDFMARPTLRELHTKSIKRIPAAVFLRLVGSAPMLAFHSVTLAEGVKSITLTALRYLGTLQDLILEADSLDVCNFLTRSDTDSYTVTLRRLSTWIAWTHATTLISSAARTLEDLRFRFGASMYRHSPSRSPLRSDILKSNSICETFSPCGSWAFSHVLAPKSSPALAEITVTFYTLSWVGMRAPFRSGYSLDERARYGARPAPRGPAHPMEGRLRQK
ncbi:hypothetical protein DFH09DRAFT_359094 [Mycena vulgaris]|nr:hypothetical protein DFH09DRAFT_359094 [Mycena vulgaris]